ncbi:MAG TPA: flavin reductase family protein [Tepidiformaceae bacterium]|nr:flavin reductase family protein [Tepidiformaceae bacterium]
MSTSPRPPVHPDDFKGALGSWAAGVTIVTTKHDEGMYGITVSSFSSLSVDPLLILVCVMNSNHMARLIPESKRFAVSILADDQSEVSGYFAVSGRDPGPDFGGIEYVEWHTGAPIISGALAHLDCELEAAIPGGDHTIMIGRVVGAASNPDAKPLLYYRRGYRTVSGLE